VTLITTGDTGHFEISIASLFTWRAGGRDRALASVFDRQVKQRFARSQSLDPPMADRGLSLYRALWPLFHRLLAMPASARAVCEP
jgi:hypothetical protein